MPKRMYDTALEIIDALKRATKDNYVTPIQLKRAIETIAGGSPITYARYIDFLKAQGFIKAEGKKGIKLLK